MEQSMTITETPTASPRVTPKAPTYDERDCNRCGKPYTPTTNLHRHTCPQCRNVLNASPYAERNCKRCRQPFTPATFPLQTTCNDCLDPASAAYCNKQAFARKFAYSATGNGMLTEHRFTCRSCGDVYVASFREALDVIDCGAYCCDGCGMMQIPRTTYRDGTLVLNIIVWLEQRGITLYAPPAATSPEPQRTGVGSENAQEAA